MTSAISCMQRTKTELEGEVSALTESLEALRSASSGICQLAAEAATAAEAGGCRPPGPPLTEL